MTGNIKAIESLSKENPEQAKELIEQNKEAFGDTQAQEKYEELEEKIPEIPETRDIETTDTTDDTEAGTGDESGDNFRLLISDAPADIGDFDYLIVHLSKTRIFRIDGGESGFEEKEIDASVDLTKLVGEASAEVLSTELEPGRYSKIELYVSSVDAKAGNSTANVMVPSNKLQIVNSFEVLENETTTFVFDINVVRKGLGNEYNLIPVISKSGVVGKDLGENEVEEVEPTECNEDVACDEGYECVNGECEEIENEQEETETPECSEEISCSEGYECINGDCEVIEGESEMPENTTEIPENQTIPNGTVA
ncbi:MAG: DUF4382 domain-containing protein [Candidatus Altiarchaeota archaeon]|nr:DUF4382 domain-containing protein [Candidatus Altiarchaeota archaeon]